MGQYLVRHKAVVALISGVMMFVGVWVVTADRGGSEGRFSDFLRFSAPAGNRPATTNTVINGVSAAILPNGRLVTPAGTEVNVQAPKPFGLALSPDGRMLATLNSGAAPFSLTLITQFNSQTPAVKRVDVNASFMGVTFSPDSRRVYLSGGENGNIWTGDAAAGQIIGSVNLNGPTMASAADTFPDDRLYTVPGLGSPNAPESSSVYVLDVSNPQTPETREIVKTGPRVGQRENGIDVYSGSHPNAVVVGPEAIYVANGNNDSIPVLDPRSYEERGRIGLSLLRGQDRTLKGVQPVGLALSPDGEFLYVAEAGINAVGVIRLNRMHGHVIGHFPTGCSH